MRICDVLEVGDAALQPDLGKVRIGVGRQRSRRRGWCLCACQSVAGSRREPVLDVDLSDDGDAALGKEFVPAGVVAVEMRVDEIFDRFVRDRFDGGLDLVVQRRVLAVHHDDAVFPYRHGDISALAFEHVDVVAEVGGLDLDF